MPEEQKRPRAFVHDFEFSEEYSKLLATVFEVSMLAYGAAKGKQKDGSPLEESDRNLIITEAKGDLAAAFDRYIEAMNHIP